MAVYCDECGYEFEPKIQWFKIREDIRQEYFKCPKCRERYLVVKTNKNIRDLRRSLKQGVTVDSGGILKAIEMELRKIDDILA